MPRSDGERDHDQLRKNQSREADRHDVNELIFEENQRAVHDDAAWKEMKVNSSCSGHHHGRSYPDKSRSAPT